MKWQLHSDGSFDAHAGGVALRHAYPTIDGIAIRPVSIGIRKTHGGGTLTYRSSTGTLRLTFGTDARGLTLRTHLCGFPKAPHRVAPIGGAEVAGADRFFRQAVGMGGPTTFERIANAREVLRSHAVSALLADDDTTLVIAALDHRRFPQVSQLMPASASFEVAFHTEGIPLPDGAFDLPVLNPQADSVMERFSMRDLVGKPRMHVFEWMPGTARPLGRQDAVIPELKRHSAILYYVSPTATGPATGFRLGSDHY